MIGRFKEIRLLNLKNYFSKQNQLKIIPYSTKSIDDKIFLRDKYSNFTFKNLNILSSNLSKKILENLKSDDLKGEKVAVLCSNNYSYLISLLAVWKANGVPLGLNKEYPLNLVEYFLNDSKCRFVINGQSIEETKEKTLSSIDLLLAKQKVINYKLNENEFYLDKSNLNENQIKIENSFDTLKSLLNLPENLNKEALILYTSGTSGPPKGVVLTRANMTNTVETLIDAWKWTPKDCLLHVLPLNHVHGLTYGLLTAFYAGAEVEMLPRFNAEMVWSKLLDNSNNINAFMAVPTIFVNLVEYYIKNDALKKKYNQEYIRETFKNKIRLVASGSAPLNVKTHNEWNEITNYSILERYGMTEIGLGLSNPYIETKINKRVAGAVGRPFGKTQVRIVEQNDSNEDSKHVLIESDPNTDKFFNNSENKTIFGELQIKGSMVFKEYLGKPIQTKETFTDDGWFKTGDTAEFLKDKKIYKLIGRTSVDVIKSGGYKISALDIEKELLAHPNINDVSVMGLKDPVWGQKIFALIVLKEISADQFKRDEFIKWCKTKLPKYSVPKLIKFVDKMPRNQIGKVNKKELIKQYENETKFD